MFRIEIAAGAQADADAAYAWMVENISPAYAERWYRELSSRSKR
jgi:plasmid stabilization system protein ParE